MFPLSDSIRSNTYPFINLALIAANVVVFIIQLISPDSFSEQFALIPSAVNFADPATLYPFFTAMFLHGGFLHIIFNMWFLYIFGDDVEANFGHWRYLLFYLFFGLIGNTSQFLLMPQSSVPMLGASGAIAGVLGAYFIMFPQSQIKTLVPIFGLPAIINIAAPIMLGYWFVLQLISGTVSLPDGSGQGGVAFWAHVGGFIAGIVIAKLFGQRIEGENAYVG